MIVQCYKIYQALYIRFEMKIKLKVAYAFKSNHLRRELERQTQEKSSI